jgi:pimeloyl-ACP methyl ester carboxylesterase
MSQFQGPMRAWPGLEAYAHTIGLAQSGLNLYVYDTGQSESPAVVLIHGLGDESDSWRHVVEPLSARYRVVAPDLPGFGRSDKPRRAYTVPFLCDTVLGLMDALSIASATLIGSSLGAVIAQSIALERRERVRGLVLIGGTLLAGTQPLNLPMLLFLVPGVGEWLYTRLRKDPQAAFETLRGYYADLDELPEADRAFLFQRVNERVWSDGQRRAYFSVLRHTATWVPRQQRDLDKKLAQLATPTLVIRGEHDYLMPVANAQALADVQPSATLVTIPRVGHLPQQERPQALLDAILADERLA